MRLLLCDQAIEFSSWGKSTVHLGIGLSIECTSSLSEAEANEIWVGAFKLLEVVEDIFIKLRFKSVQSLLLVSSVLRGNQRLTLYNVGVENLDCVHDRCDLFSLLV